MSPMNEHDAGRLRLVGREDLLHLVHRLDLALRVGVVVLVLLVVGRRRRLGHLALLLLECRSTTTARISCADKRDREREVDEYHRKKKK